MGFNVLILCEFLLFNFIWIQIPGMMFDALLMRKRRFWATKLLSGYVLGLVFLTFLYFIQGVMGFNLLITIAGPVMSIGSVIFWIRHGKTTLFSNGKKIRPEQIVLFIIVSIMSVLAFQLKWALAPMYDSVQINHDVLYHVGNIVTLSRKVPAQDLRVLGIPFYYHYIYDLVYGMCKNVFHMDAYSLYITGQPALAAYPLTLALCMLGDRCFDKRKHTDLENVAGRKVRFNYKYLIYLVGTLLCGVCIYPITMLAEYFPLSWLNYHLFSNINSIGFAVVASVLFIDFIANSWKDEFGFRALIVLFAYSFFGTGAKGPTGAMFVATSFAVAIVHAIIEKKINWVRIGYFIATTLGFISCYVMIVAGFGGTGGNNRAVAITPSGTILLSRVGNVFNSHLGIDPYDPRVMWLVLILIAICVTGPGVLSVIGFIGIKLRRLRKENNVGDIYDWFCICMILVAIGGCLFTSVEGFSQGYMVLSASPFIFYCCMRYVQRGKLNILKYIQYAAFVVGFTIFLADISFFAVEDFRNGGYTYATSDKAWVSQGELEGYKWIRENTPMDALICTDRRTEHIDYRSTYYYISAIGERQVYLEGHSYSDVPDDVADKMMTVNRNFYSSDPAIAEASLSQNKIDYMVVSNVTHSMYEVPSERLELVYSNDDVRIYEFN